MNISPTLVSAEDNHISTRRETPNSEGNLSPIIFLLSAPRSGSTILRAMLTGHPGLFAPPELALLMFDDMGTRRAQLPEENFDHRSLILALESHLGTSGAHAQLADWVARKTSTREVYSFLQKCIGSRILVDKTPDYGFDLDVLRRAPRWFPNAKYIHLVRHPGAVVESFIRTRGIGGGGYALRFGPMDLCTLAEQVWTMCCGNILDFYEELPSEARLLVKYEELVKRPEDEMRRICAFLDLPFHSETLDPYHGERMLDGWGDPNIRHHRTIEPSLSENWRKNPLARPLSRHVQLLGAHFGYPEERELPPRRDRLLNRSVTSSNIEPTPVFLLAPPSSGHADLIAALANDPGVLVHELALLMFTDMRERQSRLPYPTFDEMALLPLLERAHTKSEAQRILDGWIANATPIREVYSQLQILTGAAQIIDYTPEYSFEPMTLQKSWETFPQARYIYLARDPAGVVDHFSRSSGSASDSRFSRLDPFTLAEQIWTLCSAHITDFFGRISTNARHIIQYRDLVRQPQEELDKLGQFLGRPLRRIGKPVCVEAGLQGEGTKLSRVLSRHVRILASDLGYITS